MVCHEILRWSQLSLWTSVAQPPGTDRQINEGGSTPPCWSRHLLAIKAVRKTEGGILCLSIITRSHPNLSKFSFFSLFLAVQCIFTVCLIYCKTAVNSVSDSQAYTCGCVEASEGSQGVWWAPNQTVTAQDVILKLLTRSNYGQNYHTPQITVCLCNVQPSV